MKLHELEKLPGLKRPKRVGRGTGSGHGKTSTRGHKGQKARAGGPKRIGFEGGQLPLYRRLPHQRGFKPINRVSFYPLNVAKLGLFPAGSTVTRGLLYEMGLIPSADTNVKILGDGELKVNLSVEAQAFSANARAKIEAAGGKVEMVS
ncbi:MAG: 50S ribosomal protein L15 [Coprothermobacterota bacterium]|jgi:large subunit ribosomal protein L15|nr:50S ribosomal protein L15 [Coprothermobacterota bacterium]